MFIGSGLRGGRSVIAFLRPGTVPSLPTSPNSSEIEGEENKDLRRFYILPETGVPNSQGASVRDNIKSGTFYWVLGRHASSRPLGEYVEKVGCF